MPESLGEAFIEVLADTSPFGQSLEIGVSDAMSSVQSDVEDALGEIPAAADDAFGEAAASAIGAGSDMSSAFDGAASDMQDSLDSVDGTGLADRIRDNLGKIALGGAAAGAGLETFARRERDAQVEARFLARATGMSEDSMLDLIAATSDATFPIEDVTGLMRIAAQRGLEGSDSLQDFAQFWDMVGDATGESAVELGKAGLALAQVGIGAGDESEAIDALGFIMDNTTIETGKFLRFVGRVGTELGENTPSIDEMAGALGAMEAAGLDVRVAQSELQAALKESDGDLLAALETIGISEDAYREQVDAVEGSGAAIEGNADIFADARTPIEEMTASIRAQLFRYPQLGEAAGALAGPLTALGPAAMGFTHGAQALQMISGGVGKALAAMRTGFMALGKVILANPIFLIAAVLIGLAVIIFKFREEIIEALVGAWEFIKEKVGALLEWFGNAIPDAIAAVVAWVKNNWPLILAIITGPIGLAVKFIVDNWEAIRETIANAVRAIRNAIRRGFDAIRNFIRTSIDRIRNFVVNGFNTLRDRATGAVEALRDNVRSLVNNVINFVTDIPSRIIRGLGNLGGLLVDKGREMIQGFLNGATGLLSNIGRFLIDRIPGWIRAPFEKALGISSPSKVFAEIGRDTIAGFAAGIQDEIGTVGRLMDDLGADIPMSVSPSITGGIGALTGDLGRGGRSVDVTMHVHNPAPEPMSASASREMRKLAAIGLFGD